MHSPGIKTALDIADNIINEEREYVETTEQAERVAKRILGNSIALEWTLTTALNPALRVGDKIDLAWDTEGGRTYSASMLVAQVVRRTALGPNTAASMDITARMDYNSVKATLATRT